MEHERERVQRELGQIESINSIDTARMTLRWALERLHGVEKRSEELARELSKAQEALAALELERDGLKHAANLRLQDEQRREDYYKRMNEFIAIRLSGHPDAAEQARRELELAKAQERLHLKEMELEKAFVAQRDVLAAEAAELQARLKEEAAEEMRRSRQAEQARQARAERQLEEQRVRLEQQVKHLQAELERQASSRIAQTEALLEAENDGKSKAWEREKAAIVKDLTHWQQTADQRLKQLSELERAVDAVKAEALRQTRAYEARIQHLEDDQARWSEERDELASERKAWHAKAQQAWGRVEELALKLEEQEQAARAAAAAEAVEAQNRRKAEERLAQTAAEEAARRADLESVEKALLAREKDLEDESTRRTEAWLRREEELRRREKDWHRNLTEWQMRLTEKTREIDTLKQKLLESIQEYSKRR